MKRILLVTTDYPPRLGGVATYYNKLVNQLGSDISVLTSVPGKDKDDIKTFRKKLFWSFWPHWLPLIWLIPDYLKKTSSKIVWAGQLLPIGTACLINKLLWQIPYFVSLHGLDIQLVKVSPWKNWLAAQILKEATFITTNSKFTAGLLSDYQIPTDKIIVIYPQPQELPKPEQRLIDELKTKYHLINKKVILTVSRLVKRKGITEVLEALPMAVKQNSNLVYVIVGDGPEKANIEARIKELGLPAILVGAVSQLELRAWYSICDIFILVPLDNVIDVEGFGIVYLEAQAAGKPVIGSRVGGVPEAVGEAGLLVSNQAELLASLTNLLQNSKERKRLGEIGFARVNDQFNITTQANKLREVLTSL
ncbi:MAG: glycosyltransferase family 4 protein [Patescibacteria group bacterium]